MACLSVSCPTIRAVLAKHGETLMFGGCVIAAGVLGGIPAALGALGAFLSSRLFRYSETRIIAKEPPSLRNTPNPPLPAKPPIVSPIQKIETPVKIDEEEFEEVEIPAEDLYCADAERDAVETGAMVLGERLLGLRAKIAFGLKPEEEQRRIAKEMLARFYAKVRFEHPELDPTSVEILVHARKKVEFFLLQLPTLSNKEMEQLLKQEGLFPEI